MVQERSGWVRRVVRRGQALLTTQWWFAEGEILGRWQRRHHSGPSLARVATEQGLWRSLADGGLGQQAKWEGAQLARARWFSQGQLWQVQGAG